MMSHIQPASAEQSASPKPRVVTAGVPSRMPLVTKGDWGAFGTVDFERTMPEFDKARYKADRLREQLTDVAIRMGIVKERLPGKAKYMVLKYLKMGVIELGQIINADMLALARLYLRARRLRDEIWQLEQACEGRMRRRLERFLG